MPAERRRALVVGIDDYPDAPLAGCVNDANAMGKLLRAHEDGSPNFSVKAMLQPSQVVTRSGLRAALAKLFSDLDEADVALFYFSGHGTFDDDFRCLLPVPRPLVFNEFQQREVA